MPSAVVSNAALLLTKFGWISCGDASRTIEIAGIDRYGKVMIERVAVRLLKSHTRSVFVGTTRCCGVFDPQTRLFDSHSADCEVADLVNGSIGTFRFEFSASQLSVELGHEQREAIWQALATEAAFIGESQLAIRCRSRQALSVLPQSAIRHSGTRTFFVLDKPAITQPGADMSTMFQNIAEVFRDVDGISRFSRDNCYLVMTIIGHLCMTSRSYELIFDTLQHTAEIGIRSPGLGDSALGFGRSAQYLNLDTASLEVSWPSRMWNPICNGLVLIGE